MIPTRRGQPLDQRPILTTSPRTLGWVTTRLTRPPRQWRAGRSAFHVKRDCLPSRDHGSPAPRDRRWRWRSTRRTLRTEWGSAHAVAGAGPGRSEAGLASTPTTSWLRAPSALVERGARAVADAVPRRRSGESIVRHVERPRFARRSTVNVRAVRPTPTITPSERRRPQSVHLLGLPLSTPLIHAVMGAAPNVDVSRETVRGLTGVVRGVCAHPLIEGPTLELIEAMLELRD